MLEHPVSAFTSHPASQWTEAVKLRFLDCLARKGNVRAACAWVGLSAETAYRQRRRDPVFARAWAAAMALARPAIEQVLADRAIDGIEEEVWYRGELMGTRRRYDSRLLLAAVGRIDRQVDARAEADAERFDELLAVLAGVQVPEALADEDGLPMSGEAFVAQAVGNARAAVLARAPADDWRDFGRAYSEDENDARGRAEEELLETCDAAARHAEGEARRLLDQWRGTAHAAVDAALDATGAEAADGLPGTVSTVSTPPPVE